MPRRRQTGSPAPPPATRRLTFRPGPTWSSSAPASPGCGPLTTCCSRTRPSTSWCSRRSTSASARAVATAAGCRPCGRSGRRRWPAAAAPRPREPWWPSSNTRSTRSARATESAAIDCGFRKGGTIALARSPAQAARARAEVDDAAEWGVGTRWLGAAEASERLAASRVEGATFSPHCARVHPRRLVDGLAVTVRAQGAQVHEGVRVQAIEPGRVALEGGGQVAAPHVIRATEAWTARLPGHRRTVAPVYSLMVATEPLSDEQWSRIGLAEREVFSDHRHVIIYGQRTVDDRLAFGGRGAPYHFGSRIKPEFDHEATVFADLRATLTDSSPSWAT